MTRTFLHSFDPPADSPVTGATIDLTVADIEDTGIREVLQTPGTAYGAWFIPDALLTPTGAGTPFVRRPQSLPILPFDNRRVGAKYIIINPRRFPRQQPPSLRCQSIDRAADPLHQAGPVETEQRPAHPVRKHRPASARELLRHILLCQASGSGDARTQLGD